MTKVPDHLRNQRQKPEPTGGPAVSLMVHGNLLSNSSLSKPVPRSQNVGYGPAAGALLAAALLIGACASPQHIEAESLDQQIEAETLVHANAQTVTPLPTGTIHLRAIDRIGGRTLKGPITWRVMTVGRNDEGRQHQVAEVTGATPKLVLPAARYIVYAKLPDREFKHAIEVTAGRTYKYTMLQY